MNISRRKKSKKTDGGNLTNADVFTRFLCESSCKINNVPSRVVYTKKHFCSHLIRSSCLTLEMIFYYCNIDEGHS